MLTIDFDTLNVCPGHLVLDAGCGQGRHSFEYVSRGAKVFSMDMDMESLKKTRFMLWHMKKQNMFPTGSACQVISGDALSLPFNSGTFDRIICSEVMEHIRDDDLACRELARVLKKNGKIAFTVPTYISEMIYDILTYEYFTSPGGHIRKYVPAKLAEIMQRNGLVIYNVDFRHSFHTIYWIIRCVVGLHLEDQPLTKAYRNFLLFGESSVILKKLERFFDNFFPKSIILYAYKS